MPTWAKQLENHTQEYLRHGSKTNRKKVLARITEFLEYTDADEPIVSLHRLGKRHVINFWKSRRDLSEKNAYEYWLAIGKLWDWLDKHDEPPKAIAFSGTDEDWKAQQKVRYTSRKTYNNISDAIKAARTTRQLSEQQLANMTGYETQLITEIENGATLAKLSEVLRLLDILGITITLEIDPAQLKNQRADPDIHRFCGKTCH